MSPSATIDRVVGRWRGGVCRGVARGPASQGVAPLRRDIRARAHARRVRPAHPASSVTALRATLSSGGHVRYAGRGNWLVTIAPYVVPVFACVVVAVGEWLDAPRTFSSAVVGAALAWNLVANWSPSHRHHGDHRELGTVFAFVVIACANALVLGFARAYASTAHSLTAHLAHVRGPAAAFFSWLVHLISRA